MKLRPLIFFLFLLTQNSFSKTLLVADKKEGSIYFHDIDRNFAEITRLKVAKHPHEISASPDGRYALVSHYGGLMSPGRTLTLIDLADGLRKYETRLQQPLSRPHGLAFINNEEALVTIQNSTQLWKYTVRTKGLSPYLQLDETGFHMIKVDREKKFAYISNNETGNVVKVNLETSLEVGRANVGKSADGLDVLHNVLLVTNRKENKVIKMDCHSMGSKTYIEIPVSKSPVRVMIDDDGDYAGVVSSVSGKVDVINLDADTDQERSKERFSPVGAFKKMTLLSLPVTILKLDDDEAFVANTFAGHISHVDISTSEVLVSFRSGKQPDGMAISSMEIYIEPSLKKAISDIEEVQFFQKHQNQFIDEEGFARDNGTKVSLVINGKKENVWNVLTDLENYGMWNPFMVRVKSNLQVGDPIHFKVKLKGKFPYSRTLKISERVEHEKLCWSGRVMGPLFHVKRCFYLKTLSGTKSAPNRTLYYTYERFGGPLADTMKGLFGNTLWESFFMEARALKSTVEEL